LEGKSYKAFHEDDLPNDETSFAHKKQSVKRVRIAEMLSTLYSASPEQSSRRTQRSIILIPVKNNKLK
jgi:hypothetical protein